MRTVAIPEAIVDDLRDLMTRMGHTSARAALIHQHATSESDRAIGASLDLVQRHRDGVDAEAAGTQRA